MFYLLTYLLNFLIADLVRPSTPQIWLTKHEDNKLQHYSFRVYTSASVVERIEAAEKLLFRFPHRNCELTTR